MLVKNFVAIDDFTSEMESLKYRVLQGSVLGALLFFQPLHFIDDTYLLNIQKTISEINKLLNRDLKF